VARGKSGWGRRGELRQRSEVAAGSKARPAQAEGRRPASAEERREGATSARGGRFGQISRRSGAHGGAVWRDEGDGCTRKKVFVVLLGHGPA